MGQVKNYNATVLENVLVAKDTYRMRIELENAPEFDFLPGQFVNILVAPMARRSYSIASSPHVKEYIETFANAVAGGPGSMFFKNSRAGDKISLLGPLGQFVYKEDTKPVYFFATGTGVTPFMSMIRYALEINKSGRQIVLVSGFRFAEDAFGQDTFTQLEKTYANFKYIQTLSRPADDWQGSKGRVTEYVKLIEDRNSDAYLCGSQAMINDIQAMLLAHGLPVEQIYYEQFY